MDEEQEDLRPDPPLTPDTDACNNNEPAFINEMDKITAPDCKGDVDDTMAAAVMFPMEIPAAFPNVTLGPGPRPGLLVCNPIEKICAEHYGDRMESEKRELEVKRVYLLKLHFRFKYLTN